MTNDVQTAVRLPSSIVDELDAIALRMTRSTAVRVTRAAVIRMLVVRGIAEEKNLPGESSR